MLEGPMTITFFTRTSRLAQQRIKSGGRTRSSCLIQCKDAAPPEVGKLIWIEGGAAALDQLSRIV
jgi:hypothetical protein